MTYQPTQYEQQVYAGVLGKVIGVYLGRPFEGYPRVAIEKKWGEISGYVHEDQGVPLVVADDDITGTFTFIRALEDSGLYEKTPVEFFGDMWLDYLIEGKTILWWGGMGHSTEHTAYLRLKQGLRSPESGSIERNGQVVAEQIGAQIFIDAFGMVAPGKPELAAELARKAALVSHDGEAVHAAVVVAAMVSQAFVSQDMDDIIATALLQIPADSLIATIHRDVNEWVKADGDWRKTYDRIDEKYGYHKYGGNCHVVPNHAIMAMAWRYAPDDFYEAQKIINTAGWDTDCNAANVGSVMGIKVGLDRICERYDFVSPFGDRILLPTAEGTRSVSDCAIEAMHIARVGRKIMRFDPLSPAKDGAWHHFTLPGSLHGWMSEEENFATRSAAQVSNVGQSMRVEYDVSAGKTARVSTPITAKGQTNGGYGLVGTPRIVSGQRVSVFGNVPSSDSPQTPSARLFVRTAGESSAYNETLFYSDRVPLTPGTPLEMHLTVPDCQGDPVQDVGLEIVCDTRVAGSLSIDRVVIGGAPELSIEVPTWSGWILDSNIARGAFSNDKEPVRCIGKNEGVGVAVTGNTDWADYTISARMYIHLADRGGIIARYQGLKRWIGLCQTGDTLQLIVNHYGEKVVAERPRDCASDVLHEYTLTLTGNRIQAFVDGEPMFDVTDDTLSCGGAGILFDTGMIGVRDIAVGS